MEVAGKPGWPALLVGGLVVALAGGVGGGLIATRFSPAPTTACDAVQVAQTVLPAVVTVFASGSGSSGSGSGAIIAADGVILTNDHVIDVAARSGTIEVLLNNGESLPATLVGTDPLTDLAVLRIERTNLPSLPLDANRSLVVGQPVVALGAPLGLSGTVTAGIVSALNRDVPVPKASGGTTVLAGAIQTDAAINPGNSGGPMVTCDGQLVGVNTAGATVPNANGVAGGGSVGINFAVPVATAKRISDQLLSQGRATHPWIGAKTAEIPAAVASRLGSVPGLFVQEVTAGGPAAAAGLAKGDIITTIKGTPATSITLAFLLVSAGIGDQVPIEFRRGAETKQTTLTLAEQP